MKDAEKVFWIAFAFFLGYLLFGIYNFVSFGSVNNVSDFAVHWGKVQDLTFRPDYPSTYHFIFQVFSSHELIFYGANIFLICFIIPFLLFRVTKTYWSAVLYFLGVALPHSWIYGATYPQAFVFMLVLIYLCNRKNPYVFVLAGLLASLIHKEGIYLFGLILVAELADYILSNYIRRVKEEFAFAEAREAKQLWKSGAVFLATQKFNDAQHYLFYLATQISLPVWIFSRRIFQSIFYFIFCAVPLFLLNMDARIISVTQLGLIIVASPEIAGFKHKKWVWFVLLFYLAFYLMEFALGTTNLLSG